VRAICASSCSRFLSFRDIVLTTAGDVVQTLKEARTERYGPFVGVRWRFCARKWRRRPDSNRRITDLQSAPLTTWVRRRVREERILISHRRLATRPAQPHVLSLC
jgi:hypothetical protein